jgi:hypothetical protein
MIKRLIHDLFNIIPRPISALDCVSGWYGGLGMIPGLIWKRSCINLYILICVQFTSYNFWTSLKCYVKYHILFYDGMYINYIFYFIYNSVSSYACILILQIEEVRCCYDTLLIYIFVYWFVFFHFFFQTFIHYFCTISNIFKQRRKQYFSLWITHIKNGDLRHT